MGLYFLYFSIIFNNPSFSVFCKKNPQKKHTPSSEEPLLRKGSDAFLVKNPNPKPQEYRDVSLGPQSLLIECGVQNFTPLHLKEDYRRLWTNSSSDGLFPDSGWLPHIQDTHFSEQWTCSNTPMQGGNETRLRHSTTSTISMTLRHSTCKDMRSTGHKSQNTVMLQADATHQTKLCKLRADSIFISNIAPEAG